MMSAGDLVNIRSRAREIGAGYRKRRTRATGPVRPTQVTLAPNVGPKGMAEGEEQQAKVMWALDQTLKRMTVMRREEDEANRHFLRRFETETGGGAGRIGSAVHGGSRLAATISRPCPAVVVAKVADAPRPAVSCVAEVCGGGAPQSSVERTAGPRRARTLESSPALWRKGGRE
ncbi:uncharacterized protein AB9W97_003821 [Spinachia spinachia]